MGDGMNIVADFNIDDIIRKATDSIADIIDAILLAMQLACIKTVDAARSLPSPPVDMRGKPHQPNYIDKTGYLRGSIGYAIYKDGATIAENFEGTENGNAGAEAAQGQAAARNLAAEVAGHYSQGVVAVVVCGSEYAAAVESYGYDVLTGSAKELGNIFKEYIEEVKSKYGL